MAGLRERFFNTAGPNREEDHYTLDPLTRVNYDEISHLMRQKSYFVLHAPRQTGKTSALLAMAERINREGQYRCVYMNVESAQIARNDVADGIKIVLGILARQTERFCGVTLLLNELESLIGKFGNDAFNAALSLLSRSLDKFFVLFIDEIDSLVGDTLISVLRQLRSGYESRPRLFPVSVILCGVRDVRDYRIHRSDGEVVTGGSCFNIKSESLRLGDFSPEDIESLYGQHTTETGQIFEENVYPRVWELTQGQPWLVNALAHEAVWRMRENRDRLRVITREIIERAKENLILSRATHLDQLMDKLREPRVHRTIAPMLSGDRWDAQPLDDDLLYVADLGLIKKFDETGWGVANAIYREVIPRSLNHTAQDELIPQIRQVSYIAADGGLLFSKLLSDFQSFFRENIESWKNYFLYPEATYQLLMQAFLQRILNGSGRVEREYALGSKRVDIFVRWFYPTAQRIAQERKEQRFVVELKKIYHSREAALKAGLPQVAAYAAKCAAQEAHLVLFDPDDKKGWDEKIFDEIREYSGRTIRIWGM